MTYGALRATLPLNVRGLRMAPLRETVAGEAARLRAAGAQIVVVALTRAADATGSTIRQPLVL